MTEVERRLPHEAAASSCQGPLLRLNAAGRAEPELFLDSGMSERRWRNMTPRAQIQRTGPIRGGSLPQMFSIPSSRRRLGSSRRSPWMSSSTGKPPPRAATNRCGRIVALIPADPQPACVTPDRARVSQQDRERRSQAPQRSPATAARLSVGAIRTPSQSVEAAPYDCRGMFASGHYSFRSAVAWNALQGVSERPPR